MNWFLALKLFLSNKKFIADDFDYNKNPQIMMTHYYDVFYLINPNEKTCSYIVNKITVVKTLQSVCDVITGYTHLCQDVLGIIPVNE